MSGYGSYVDEPKVCVDCKADFLFTAGEQKFFYEKGLTEPKRCKECRKRKGERKQKGRQFD